MYSVVITLFVIAWYSIGLLGSYLANETLNNRYPHRKNQEMTIDYYFLALAGPINILGAWTGLGGFTLNTKDKK